VINLHFRDYFDALIISGTLSIWVGNKSAGDFPGPKAWNTWKRAHSSNLFLQYLLLNIEAVPGIFAILSLKKGHLVKH
jgi:hypothetical protein